MYGDQYKGFMDFRSDSPDHDPRFALLYVVVVAVLLAVVLVRWLGWTWQTLATYLAVQSAVVGGWAYLRARSRRRRDERRIALREADRWA